MPTFSLRTLMGDNRPHVVKQAKAVVDTLARSVPSEEYIDLDLDNLLKLIVTMRQERPDKSTELSVIDSKLIPLLELHRAVFVSMEPEEQLEPSEMDLLTFGVTYEDLAQTAIELGCVHLGCPTGNQPEKGLVVGIKERILVVRNVTIKNTKRSVTFILDLLCPVSYMCETTVRAFGFSQSDVNKNFVGGVVEGGVRLNFYFLSPEGDKRDLNILGMDYLKKVDAVLEFNGFESSVCLIPRRSTEPNLTSLLVTPTDAGLGPVGFRV